MVSQIYGLDLTDEAIRKEPWLQSKEACRRFIIDLFNNLSIETSNTSGAGYIGSAGGDITLPLYSGTLNTMSKSNADKITNNYFNFNCPSIYSSSNNGATDNDRGNFYGMVSDGTNSYFYYALKYLYSSKINSSSLAQCKGKFVERIGIYNNESTIELSEDAGQQVVNMGTGTTTVTQYTNDEGEEKDKYTYIVADAAASRHVIQYIYIGENDSIISNLSSIYN